MRFLAAAALLLSVVALPSVRATEDLDYAAIQQIRDEGLSRSQVMDHISWLADVFGPRLTGGPGIRQASDWAMQKFDEWGLANPHREHFSSGAAGSSCASTRT